MDDPELLADRGAQIFERLARSISVRTQESVSQAKPRFSVFDHDNLMEAGQFSALMSIHSRPENTDHADPTRALDLVDDASSVRDPSMLFHALALFATHDPAGRTLRKPRMMKLQPEAALPAARPGSGPEGATGPEAILDYWRENAFANEHHQHWHEVYPGIGVIRPVSQIPPAIVTKVQNAGTLAVLDDDELRQVFRRQDRHGELFVYMHQQMLARYDAERLSNNLSPVMALDPDALTAMIPEGFSPGPDLASNFGPRPPGTQMPASAATLLAGWVDAIEAAIANGALPLADGTSQPITPTDLGDQVEAVHSLWRADFDADALGNLHNTGHGVLAGLSGVQAGVMNSTATAIRDPIFYRWHRLVDDLAASWQDTQPDLDLSDAPAGRLAGADAPWASHGIVLLDSASLPQNAYGTVDQPAAEALAETVLGGANWDTPVAVGAIAGPSGESVTTLDILKTKMRSAAFPDPQTPGETVDVAYPVHEPFAYALRLENPTAAPVDVTVRLFLCPETLADDRRAWIEMDKFPISLAANTRRVVLRRDTDSSVVKKPAEPVLTPDLVSDEDGDPRCDCGWPYTLLLPKGTLSGMSCRLMVVLTDAALDQVTAPGTCGSLSFCGARDDVYPDRREMGYPFHRRWRGSITDIVSATPSMAGRSVTIEHVLPSG
ncbi:MAG: hypothetical protein CMP09_22010 [Yangia sp.]|nr:hypothetical protein [Salipiger sp.]